MMKINRTSRFKKEYRQMMKRGYDSRLFEYVVGEIASGRSLAPRYNDILTLTLTRTGIHADLLKK